MIASVYIIQTYNNIFLKVQRMEMIQRERERERERARERVCVWLNINDFFCFVLFLGDFWLVGWLFGRLVREIE